MTGEVRRWKLEDVLKTPCANANSVLWCSGSGGRNVTAELPLPAPLFCAKIPPLRTLLDNLCQDHFFGGEHRNQAVE